MLLTFLKFTYQNLLIKKISRQFYKPSKKVNQKLFLFLIQKKLTILDHSQNFLIKTP